MKTNYSNPAASSIMKKAAAKKTVMKKAAMKAAMKKGNKMMK